MVEKSIIIEREQAKLINNLKTSIVKLGVKNKAKHVVCDYCDEVYYYFSFAFLDKYKDEIDKIILEELSNIYIYNHKFNYFNKNIKFDQIDDTYRMAFIKALVHFDKIQDREFIKYELKYDNINVNSFYKFKLKCLEERWEEIVIMTNENSAYLLSTSSFLELLKFLVKNIEVSFDILNVYLDNKKIKVINQENDIVFECSIPKEKLSAFFIQILIEYSAKEVNIYANYNQRKSLAILNKIFDNKINFFASPIIN